MGRGRQLRCGSVRNGTLGRRADGTDMAEYSNYQRKVIERYYDHRDGIMINKLQEMVTELYLADTVKKQDQLWQRVRKVLSNLKIKAAVAEGIVQKRDAEVLARHVQQWLKSSGGKGQ